MNRWDIVIRPLAGTSLLRDRFTCARKGFEERHDARAADVKSCPVIDRCNQKQHDRVTIFAMEDCKCQTNLWSGTHLSGGVLLHGNCGKLLKCSCGDTAINLGKTGPECRNCSPVFSDAFFSDQFDLERGFFDSFVYYAGGKRVTDLLSESPDFNNADYYFEKEQVIVEFKILTTEFAGSPSHLQKFEPLMQEWINDGRLTDKACRGLEPLPESFVLAHMQLIRDQLEGITKKANKQIKQTKAKLNLGTAHGLLLVLNDGFYQANPNLTLALIGDPLRRQMRSIDAFVFLNLRRKLKVQGDNFPRFFWLPKYQKPDNAILSSFVNELGARWFAYLQELSGQKFESHVETYDPDYKEMTHAIYI